MFYDIVGHIQLREVFPMVIGRKIGHRPVPLPARYFEPLMRASCVGIETFQDWVDHIHADTQPIYLMNVLKPLANLIVVGDWNLTPELLRLSRWLDVVGGLDRAQADPTCCTSVYDYFVVHKSLNHAVRAVLRLDDGGCYPHWAVRLVLAADRGGGRQNAQSPQA